MFVIRDHQNPHSRALIDLAAEYGQPLAFAVDPYLACDHRRYAQVRFSNRPEMKAFLSFLSERGFDGDLRVYEDDDLGRYLIVCRSAMDR